MKRVFVLLTALALLAIGVALVQRPVRGEASSFSQTYVAYLKNTYGYNSTLYVQNGGAAAATVVVTFTDPAHVKPPVEITTSVVPGATRAFDSEALGTLADGSYMVLVSADQPVESLIRQNRNAEGDHLLFEPATRPPSVSWVAGPLLKGDVTSSVNLINTGGVAANVALTFYSSAGAQVGTQMGAVPAGSVYSLYLGSLAVLPAGFVGWAAVQSDQPLGGVLGQTAGAGLSPSLIEMAATPQLTAVEQWLPRVYNQVETLGHTQNTTLFIGNPFPQTTTVELQYLGAGRSRTSAHVLAPYAMAAVDVAAELPATGTFGVHATAASPFFLEQITRASAPQYGHATYALGSQMVALLPRVVVTDTWASVLHVQNTGATAAAVTLNFYAYNGALITTHQLNGIVPGAAVHLPVADVALLGNAFEGSAVAIADQPILVTVDEYELNPAPPCDPVRDIEITQEPPGDILIGQLVGFAAIAAGEPPFTYTWTIADQVLSVDGSSFNAIFGQSGTFTLGVTISNACSSASHTMPITVIEPQPDLSLSRKSVNLAHIEDGDLLNYTIVLRNTSIATATAVLTDTLPAQLTYTAESIAASSGIITCTAGTVLWHGEIVTGTPVLLEFSATVDAAGMAVGDALTNTATIADGAGVVTMLTAVSHYNPGYRVSIDDGLLYTNLPTVTLSLSWASESPATTQMAISNDGGFAAGTGWIPVNASYDGWVLDTYGDLRLVRTVYVKFRGSDGHQYGPFQDDIIYDPVAPSPPTVEIITDTGRGAAGVPTKSVIVRVTATDDNSGIGQISLSRTANFAEVQTFTPTGARTDIPWSLSGSERIYVRVADKAGNISETTEETIVVRFLVYLPLTIRA